MTVAPPHQVRRAASLAADLDDYSFAILVTHVTSLHDQFIADLCLHH